VLASAYIAVMSVIRHLVRRLVILHMSAYIMVSISSTVMCVIRLAVKSHMVILQGIHSGECTVPVVSAEQHSVMRGTF
jgi:hypothetical protein